jgi:uncharacterized protein (DUF2235 family)
MALYAFDGTWNSIHDGEEADRNTNVKRLCEMYTLPDTVGPFYLAGVGTRFGKVGRAIGGVFGAGADRRVDEMYKFVCDTYAAGHKDIEIIGFSRGAALALDLVNLLHRKGIVDPKTNRQIATEPEIKFLGLWDTVASFGLTLGPFQRINIGHRLTVPSSVRHAFHALALDERRSNFVPTRLAGAYEVWFRGVHSDVGGGNTNVGLNNITLRWMARKALLAGVPLDPAKVPADTDINVNADLREPLDPVAIGHRALKADDRIHYTVGPREGGRYMNPPASHPRETDVDELKAGLRA